ncbi:TadE/TadG family type IV pilus assembly protein [Jhaorihella thermophila]|uniref:TadE-like protein n=1 Tax=Jhaorihella thermophila TaxID=488547 RepID=A0A1H5S166_9RHOB|nr:TadE/TadG family type IV pilus assembly protein [Jhaorihella thermophila]SEF44325.1 TadE-like protein [Jhaorihella thermophila]
MKRLGHLLRRFRRSQTGAGTVEFVLVFPAVMTIMFSGIELGMVTFKQAMLERAMDLTVRDIRLGTGQVMTHDDIRDQLCARSAVITDCQNSLRLEMIRLDPRNWNGALAAPDCINRAEELSPVRNFVNGQENELMLLRACAKFDPIFPSSGLGKQLSDTADGGYALVAVSVFVQEPR